MCAKRGSPRETLQTLQSFAISLKSLPGQGYFLLSLFDSSMRRAKQTQLATVAVNLVTFPSDSVASKCESSNEERVSKTAQCFRMESP